MTADASASGQSSAEVARDAAAEHPAARRLQANRRHRLLLIGESLEGDGVQAASPYTRAPRARPPPPPPPPPPPRAPPPPRTPTPPRRRQRRARRRAGARRPRQRRERRRRRRRGSRGAAGDAGAKRHEEFVWRRRRRRGGGLGGEGAQDELLSRFESRDVGGRVQALDVREAGLERACRVPELGVLVKPAEEERVVGERQRQAAACFGSARSSAAWRDDAIAAMPSGRKTRADVPRTTMPPSSGRPPALAGRRARADAPRGRPSGAADAGRRRAAAAAADAAASRAAAADAAAVDARAPPTLGRRRRAVGDVRSARSARASVWSSASFSSSWHALTASTTAVVVTRSPPRRATRRRRRCSRLERSRVAGCAQRSAKRRSRHTSSACSRIRACSSASACPSARAPRSGRRRRQRTRRRRAGEGLVDPHRVPRDRVLIALRLPPRRRARGLTLLLFCVGEAALRQRAGVRGAARPGARSRACRRAAFARCLARRGGGEAT